MLRDFLARRRSVFLFLFFFFNDTATTEIYTLSLHDALPISGSTASTMFPRGSARSPSARALADSAPRATRRSRPTRSEEHTSELQSRLHLVCRLLLEKKKNTLRISRGPSSTTDSYGTRTVGF